MGLEDAEAAIVSATLRFAKRQMTWFRHQEDVRWFAHAGEAREAVHAWLEAPPPANSLT
jgi:tRNA A37 N6-isopentenylltransferase MiaA